MSPPSRFCLQMMILGKVALVLSEDVVVLLDMRREMSWQKNLMSDDDIENVRRRYVRLKLGQPLNQCITIGNGLHVTGASGFVSLHELGVMDAEMKDVMEVVLFWNLSPETSSLPELEVKDVEKTERVSRELWTEQRLEGVQMQEEEVGYM
ncbi:hypothetical protein IFR05_005800 [Cadophora sp. M221]|nr:hypothetical protein IFR05_005800 [Cadophora sp. M221]